MGLIRRECSDFLLNLTSTRPDAELLGTLRDHIRGEEAWREFVLHANRNRVSGIALHNMERLGRRSLIPESADTALRERVSVFVDKFPRTLQNLADIHASFTGATLPYFLFKGAALVETLYQDPGLRPFADYDLLVHRSQIDQAARLLERLGYVSTDPLARKYYLRFHLHLTYSRIAHRENIDLHWSFVGPYDLIKVEYATLLRRAEAPKNGLISNPVLSPVDQVLVNAIHLHKHLAYLTPLIGHPELPQHVISGRYLILCCDFLRLIHHYSVIRPFEELSEEMKRWNASDKVQFCARLCQALWGEDDRLTPLLLPAQVKKYASAHLLARFLASAQPRPYQPIRLSGVTSTRLLSLPAVFFPESEIIRGYYDARSSGAVMFWRIAHPVRLGLLMWWNAVCCFSGWTKIAIKSGMSRIRNRV